MRYSKKLIENSIRHYSKLVNETTESERRLRFIDRTINDYDVPNWIKTPYVLKQMAEIAKKHVYDRMHHAEIINIILQDWNTYATIMTPDFMPDRLIKKEWKVDDSIRLDRHVGPAEGWCVKAFAKAAGVTNRLTFASADKFADPRMFVAVSWTFFGKTLYFVHGDADGFVDDFEYLVQGPKNVFHMEGMDSENAVRMWTDDKREWFDVDENGVLT